MLERYISPQILQATVPTIRAEKQAMGAVLGAQASEEDRRNEVVVATNHYRLVQAVLRHVPHPCIRRRFHLEDVHGKPENIYVLGRIVALRE